MIVALAVLVLAAAVVAHRFWPAPSKVSLIDERMRDQVVVTLKSGEAFSGVLFDVDDKVWVLRNAVAVGAAEDRSNLDVDGEVVLLAANIAFTQRP